VNHHLLAGIMKTEGSSLSRQKPITRSHTEPAACNPLNITHVLKIQFYITTQA